ncbi:MAG: SOS response-associated peptidase family protein [Rhodoplanes sp.]
MPVIVPPEAFDLWLDCDRVDATTAAALIAPAPDALLEAYEVSRAVNRTANDSPALIEPLAAGQGAGATQGAVVGQGAGAPAPARAAARKPKPKKDDGQAELFEAVARIEPSGRAPRARR